tara:strand:+ start:708 stop:1256 length:549 start_codon:yes stop_codon:yes gene_type:complete
MLPCTHKFHYGCLKLWEDSLLKKHCAKDCGNKCTNLCKKNCKYHCPFCREEYNKMVLRKKIMIREGYTYDEYLLERKFCKNTRDYLKKIENTRNNKIKTHLTLELYKLITQEQYIKMIIKKKKVYKNFATTVIKKVDELKKQSNDNLTKNLVSKSLHEKLLKQIGKTNKIYLKINLIHNSTD